MSKNSPERDFLLALHL